jgi:hypothetical protein
MTVTTSDHVVRLADGRRLGYAKYGDPDGTAVVLVHGCPDSRARTAIPGHHPAGQAGGNDISDVDCCAWCASQRSASVLAKS